MDKEKHLEVIRLFLIEGYTLEKIGEAIGVTRERVRQILSSYGINRHDNQMRARMQRVYQFIIEYMIENSGVTPNQREMIEAANLHTAIYLQSALRALESAGLIRLIRSDKGNRNYARIEVIGAQWIPPDDYEQAITRVLESET